MTGGGSVFFVFEGHDIRVTHGFQLRVPPTGQPESLEVNWKDPNIPGPAEQQFHLDLLTSAVCAGNPLDTLVVTGIGLLNDVPGATIEAVFVDAGEPGKDSDTATFVIRDSSGTVVLVSSGTLERGNHQMH